MKIQLLLTFSICLFLSACVKQTAKPVSPVDWRLVKDHLEQMAQPTKVRGNIQYRDQAENGLQLWTLSGNQNFALEEANGDKMRMFNYIGDISDAVIAAELPKCKFWQFKCKRDNAALLKPRDTSR